MTALTQQTEEWLQFRKNKIGASDAPVIMEVSPWKTPYKLWEEKVGLRENNYTNKAMQEGIENEEIARVMYAFEFGTFICPKVLVSKKYDWMMASLDGISSDGKTVVEIKCPGEKDHEIAKSGKVPEKYMPQLQHQLEVCEIDVINYFSFTGSSTVRLEVHRDDKYIKKMLQKEKEFWDCLQEFTPPKLTNKDYQKKDDELWLAAASEWSSLNQQLGALEKKEKELRDKLILLSGKTNTVGGGIKVSQCIRKGNIDYTNIPELKGIDLDKYRKKACEYWQIISE